MCRWMAWHGQPVLIEELLFKTQHGIVDDSFSALANRCRTDSPATASGTQTTARAVSQEHMFELLVQQFEKKRLVPGAGEVPGYRPPVASVQAGAGD